MPACCRRRRLTRLTRFFLPCPPTLHAPGCGPQLESLTLDRLGVRALPPAVSRLSSLTALRFRGEASRGVQLAAADVSGLGELRVLDLAANLSEGLPQGATALEGLEELRAREPARRGVAGSRGGAASRAAAASIGLWAVARPPEAAASRGSLFGSLGPLLTQDHIYP